MEDMFWKFPHLGQQIFKKLSNKNLAKSKNVARSWERFITNEKFYKQKVHYEIEQKDKNVLGQTTLHKAARDGNLKECKLIIDNVEDKNPRDNVGNTPLHFALWNGNLPVFQLIFNNIEDKNPKNKYRETPLHLAAFLGHFEVFKLIFDNLEDKNPLDIHKTTALHYAALKGHLEICKYIVSRVEDKNLALNSKSIYNGTPLEWARYYNQQEIVDYLKSQIEN